MTRAERILLAVVVAMVLFAPVFLGGVDGFEQEPQGRPLTGLEGFLWAHGPFGILSFLALAAAAVSVHVSAERRGAGESPAWRLHAGILLPLGALAALALLQLVPLPRFLLRLLSPRAAAELDFLLPGDPSWRSLSVSPASTRAALEGLGVAATVLLGSLLLARRRCASGILLAAVAAAFAGAAAYGLCETYLGKDTVLGFSKADLGVGVTGTFLNRNHMAAGAALALSVALCLLARAARGLGTSPGRAAAGTAAAGVAAAVLAATVPLARSRMGLAAAALGVVALGLLAARAPRWPWWGRALVLLLAVGCAAAGTKAALDRVPALRERFRLGQAAREGFFDIRFPAWRSTLRLASRYPALGTGIGTFEVAIHETQTPENPDELIHAHSEPLEVLADGGLLGLALGVLLAAGAARASLRAAGSEDPWTRVVGCGCGAGLAALAVSAMAEFPLRIPALAVAAAVLAAVPAGLAAGDPAGPPPRCARRERLLPAVLAVAVILGGLAVLAGCRAAALRGAARRAEEGAGGVAWLAAAEAAVAAEPRDAAAQRSLSGALLADDWEVSGAEDRAARALVHAERAVDLEPFHAYGHWARARALLALGRVDDAVAAARRARSRAGGIGHLHFAAGSLFLGLSRGRPDLRAEAFDALREAGTCKPQHFTDARRLLRREGIRPRDSLAAVPDNALGWSVWAGLLHLDGDDGMAYEAALRWWRIEPVPRASAAALEFARAAGREEEARRALAGGP